jgi:hypothetical protein
LQNQIQQREPLLNNLLGFYLCFRILLSLYALNTKRADKKTLNDRV